VAGASARADTSSPWVSPAPATADSMVAVRSSAASEPDVADDDSAGREPVRIVASGWPLASVPPNLRSSVESGARTTTCFTASCPRSIDCPTIAVPIVATTDPIATPIIVPLTPNVDAISAARTAPTAEARIWRTENFTSKGS
jgi:hypothetical protein